MANTTSKEGKAWAAGYDIGTATGKLGGLRIAADIAAQRADAPLVAALAIEIERATQELCPLLNEYLGV